MTAIVERLARRFSRVRARARRRARRCRCIASIATRASPRTRRRTRRTSPRSFRRAGCPSTKAPACTSTSRPTRSGSAAACTRRRPPQLQAVREHIAANVKQLRSIVESPGFRRQVGALEGERLQRVPRGFPKDHPAAEYLRYRQFLARAGSPAGHRDEPEVLRHAARRVPAGRAARPVPERPAAARPAMSRAGTQFSKVGSRCCAMGSLPPPMTPPDDLDALVTELNAGAPRRRSARLPRVRSGTTADRSPARVAGARSSNGPAAICCSSPARRRRSAWTAS